MARFRRLTMARGAGTSPATEQQRTPATAAWHPTGPAPENELRPAATTPHGLIHRIPHATDIGPPTPAYTPRCSSPAPTTDSSRPASPNSPSAPVGGCVANHTRDIAVKRVWSR